MWLIIISFLSQMCRFRGIYSSRSHRIGLRRWTNLSVGSDNRRRDAISGFGKTITSVTLLLSVTQVIYVASCWSWKVL